MKVIQLPVMALGILLHTLVAAAEPRTAAELLQDTPFRDISVQQVLRGEIVGTRVFKESCTELSVGLVCHVPEAQPSLLAALRSGNWIAPTPKLIDRGEIHASTAEDDLAALQISSNELSGMLRDYHDNRLNLSAGERQFLGTIHLSGSATDNANRFSAAMRSLLMQRYNAYHRYGLAGILQYDRDGTTINPGSELRLSLEQTPALQEKYPALYHYLLDYPAPLPGHAEERYFWGKLIIEGEPAIGLSHRVSTGDESSALLAERAFYVSHTLNSSQSFLALLPVREGHLMFYVSRVWTDEVVGFGCPIKKLVGRSSVLGEMREIVENMNVCASTTKPPEDPTLDDPLRAALQD